jgi:predicted Zn-dependent peptidase
MCEDEAYALDKYGSAEEAEQMTAERLWAAYQTLLKEARVIFYYAGSASPERVETVIRNAFAPLITPRETQFTCEIVPEAKGEVRSYTDRFDVAQGKLALGFRTGGITADHPDYPALMVCNAIYGGTATSKLFMNVREKLSLCYFASSMMDKLKGLVVVSSGVEFSNFDVARREILAQLEAVQKGDFTDEELHVGRQALVSSLRTMQDSHSRVEDFWVTQQIAGITYTPESLLGAIERVDRSQVMRVASQLALDTIYYLTGKEA